VYPAPRAFLLAGPAAALSRVRCTLKETSSNTVGMRVFDAYRPFSVTQKFWDVTPPELRTYVANPETEGSKHNRGCAVDVTLFDTQTGENLTMPTEFDDFTIAAHADFNGEGDGGSLSAEARANRKLLIEAMAQEGFTVNPNEWWHYDYQGWEQHPLYGFEPHCL